MKTSIFYFGFLFFLLISKISLCQHETLIISEPEYINEIKLIQNTSIISLEQQKAIIKTKADATAYISGFGKVRSFYSFSPNSSYIKLSSKDSLLFIFKTVYTQENPSTYLSLIKLNTTKKQRILETSSSSLFLGSKTKEIESFELNFTKQGNSCFIVTPAQKLSPGEYAFSFSFSEQFFLFSITE